MNPISQHSMPQPVPPPVCSRIVKVRLDLMPKPKIRYFLICPWPPYLSLRLSVKIRFRYPTFAEGEPTCSGKLPESNLQRSKCPLSASVKRYFTSVESIMSSLSLPSASNEPKLELHMVESVVESTVANSMTPAIGTEDSSRPKKSQRFWIAFVTLLFSTFLTSIDATVLATALPPISAELNGTSILTFWCATSFLLAKTVVQPGTSFLSNVNRSMGKHVGDLWS